MLLPRQIRAVVTAPEGQAIRVIAETVIPPFRLVRVSGRSNGMMAVQQASASARSTCTGRLYISTGMTPVDEPMDMLPWIFLSDMDTTGWAAVGDPVYLQNALGMFGPTPGSVPVIVGRVLVRHATRGAILLDPAAEASSSAFDGLIFTVNADATAGTLESAGVQLLGGDGGTEISRALLRQDAFTDAVYLTAASATSPLNETDRTTSLVVGPQSQVTDTAVDADAVVRLVGHNPTDPVNTLRASELRLDASANATWLYAPGLGSSGFRAGASFALLSESLFWVSGVTNAQVSAPLSVQVAAGSSAASGAAITFSTEQATTPSAGVYAQVVQGTTPRSAGVLGALRGRVTSQSTDTGGTFAGIIIDAVDGGGPVHHTLLYSDSPMDATFTVLSSGHAGIFTGAMAKNPAVDAPDGFLVCRIGSNIYEIPVYARP